MNNTKEHALKREDQSKRNNPKENGMTNAC